MHLCSWKSHVIASLLVIKSVYINSNQFYFCPTTIIFLRNLQFIYTRQQYSFLNLKSMSFSPFLSLNYLKAIWLNSIFVHNLQLIYWRELCIFLALKSCHWVSSSILNQFKWIPFRLSNMIFVNNLQLIYWRQLCIFPALKSCHWVSPSH